MNECDCDFIVNNTVCHVDSCDNAWQSELIVSFEDFRKVIENDND